jgi:hypothetical protein
LPCVAQATADKATVLLERMAGAGSAGVSVGSLPAGTPRVPLPNEDIVGGVHVKTQPGGVVNVDTYHLYYNGNADALAKYTAALAAAGWKQMPLPAMGPGGGFAATTPTRSMTVYCKPNAPSIVAGLGDSGPQDLRVTINAAGGSTVDALCVGTQGSVLRTMMAGIESPLPDLHAPPGVKVTVSQAGVPNGRSAAYIEGATSASSLLDNFASELTTAGWAAGIKSASPQIVSQSFHYVDRKRTPWQCVLTIYAVDGKPGNFIAFVDITNLTTLAK